MEKKNLIRILNELLIPIGFKKKGNYWIASNNQITKKVNLQKSQFGNCFYINYGYIFNSIPLNGLTMHVCKRINSFCEDKELNMNNLLDLENDMSDEKRELELKRILSENLIQNINAINTEADLLQKLKTQSHLNDIPLVVKRYFCLPE